MKIFALILWTLIILIIGGVIGFKFPSQKAITPESTVAKIIPKPLESYTIEHLSNMTYPKGSFTLKETLPNTDGFIAQTFSFSFQPNPDKKETKQTTGLINIPDQGGTFPIVIMIRGFVDQKIYQTGMGTKRAGEYFAEKGYITIAPDFLGYAGSDTESGNIFETRFQTYTTVLALLETVKDNTRISTLTDKWDGENIFIWAHSNGGQVALTTLAITAESIPTTMWAPVTKLFPYSILYYTDESADEGKLIRRELAKFEELYDVGNYSFTKYISNITAPMQIHQGSADDAIPLEWTRGFVKNIKKHYSNIEDNPPTVEYYEYPGADHNLQPGWNTVVERNIEFFRTNLKKIN